MPRTVRCATRNCRRFTHPGVRRTGTGVNGQELADGRYCWRCRARQSAEYRLTPRQQRLLEMAKADGKLHIITWPQTTCRSVSILARRGLVYIRGRYDVYATAKGREALRRAQR